MVYINHSYQKTKSKYLEFLKSQEVLSEPFRDKIGQLNNFYLPISKEIAKSYKKIKKTRIIGLTGGQGSGKSTISKILKIILKESFNLNTVIFSIDDFYKTLKERKNVKKSKPSFSNKGVPGTHDTKLLKNCIKKLKNLDFKRTLIPKFDKSIDDRLSKNKWQKIKKKPDIVIFEGWCVGVTPQKNRDLLIPINTLEKEFDKKKIWRKWVNKELKTEYKKIFKLINLFIFLKVPSFKHVYRWRHLQEKNYELFLKEKNNELKSNKNFIMFYERLTKHMLKNLIKRNFIIKIDDKHKLKSIKFN